VLEILLLFWLAVSRVIRNSRPVVTRGRLIRRVLRSCFSPGNKKSPPKRAFDEVVLTISSLAARPIAYSQSSWRPPRNKWERMLASLCFGNATLVIDCEPDDFSYGFDD